MLDGGEAETQQDAIDVAYPNTKGKLDPDLKAEDLNQPLPRPTHIREHGSSICIDVLEVIRAAISLIATYSRSPCHASQIYSAGRRSWTHL